MQYKFIGHLFVRSYKWMTRMGTMLAGIPSAFTALAVSLRPAALHNGEDTAKAVNANNE